MEDLLITEKTKVARNIVLHAFKDKKDLAGEPYVGHIRRVAQKSSKYFKGYLDDRQKERLETVALLHDLIEDCPEWNENHLQAIFDRDITESVKKLTKKSEVSYEDYINKIATDPYARAVKLADLEDNMNIARLPVLSDYDIERLKKYHKAFLHLRIQ